MRRNVEVLWSLAVLCAPVLAGAAAPSRPADKGCVWEKLADAKLGIEAWAQRCDFGFRKVELRIEKGSITVHYSDGGDADPVIDVLDLASGETVEAGLRRIFAAKTDPKIAKRCVLAPYKEPPKPPTGVMRYTFVPDAAYAKELKAKQDPNEVGDPPCGDWGDAPDSVQYFEAQPATGARKVLFVRIGQDEPLFDEQTLRLLPPP